MARETGRTEPKYRQIASDLRARIEAGEFPDGRLPGKESLKAHYGVAVNTLDRVLQVLRSEGRIETVQGAGTFIRDPGVPERSPEFLELEPRIAAVEADLMELRAKFGYEQRSHQQDGRKARHEDAG